MSKNKKRIENLDLFFPSADGEHCVNARGLHKRIGVKDKFTAWWKRSVLPSVDLTQGLDYLVETPPSTKAEHPYCATYKLTPQAAIAVLQREKAANKRPCDNSLQAVRGRRAVDHVRKCIAAGRDVPYQALQTPTKQPLIGCRYGDEFVVAYRDPSVSGVTLTRRASPINPAGFWTLLDDKPIFSDATDGIAADLMFAMVPMITTMLHAPALWQEGSAGDLATHLHPEYDFHLKKEKKAEDTELQAAFGRIAETIENGIKEKAALSVGRDPVEEKKAVVEPIGSAPEEEPDNGMYRFAPEPGDDQFDGLGKRGRELAVDWYWMGWTESGQQQREDEMVDCAQEHPTLHVTATIAFNRLRAYLDRLPAVRSMELLREFAETIHGIHSRDLDTRHTARDRFEVLRRGLYRPEAEVLPIGSAPAEQPEPVNFTVEETLGTTAANPDQTFLATVDATLAPAESAPELDYSARDDSPDDMAARAAEVAEAWQRLRSESPVGHLHEQVECERVNPALAAMAKDVLRGMLSDAAQETEEATIFVKPPMPCNNIKVEFEVRPSEETKADREPEELDYSVREDGVLAHQTRAAQIARIWLEYGNDTEGLRRRAGEWNKCHAVNPTLAFDASRAVSALRGDSDNGTGQTIVTYQSQAFDEPTFAQTVGEIMRSEPPETEDAEELGTGDTLTVFQPRPGDSLLAPDVAIRHEAPAPDEPKRGFLSWAKAWLFGRGSSGKVVPTMPAPPPPREPQPDDEQVPKGVVPEWWKEKARAETGPVVVGSDGVFVKDKSVSDERLAEVESGASEWSKLIPVTSKDGKTWVDARALHAQLGSGRDFSSWVKYYIETRDLVEGKHFVVVPAPRGKPQGGRPAIEYLLDVATAQDIAVVSNTKVGKSIRSYLIDCEHRLRTGQSDLPAAQRLAQVARDELRQQLTSLSTLEEQIEALPWIAQRLKEIQKAFDERQRQEALNKEQRLLVLSDGGLSLADADLKAARDNIAQLKTAMSALEKERDELRQQVNPDAEEIMSRQGYELREADKRIAELEAKVIDLENQRATVWESLQQRNKELADVRAELEDRLAFIRTLQASADVRDKELQKLSDMNRELEKQLLKPASALVSERQAWDALEEELAAVKAKAAKLGEYVVERDLAFDQAQKELAEARLEAARWMALVQAPEKDITLTDFFKETESVLGYSDTAGCAYLTRKDVGVLYRKKDAVGEEYLWANNDYGCYFHHVRRFYDHPITVDGVRTDKFLSVKTYTAKLTPDEKDADGNVVRIGGFTWLKEKMMNDVLTTLQRLIAETGGPKGEFSRFDGYVLGKSRAESLPGLMSVGEKVILFAKGTGSEVKKGEWVVGCRTKDGAERATGLTLRDALRNLRDKFVG